MSKDNQITAAEFAKSHSTDADWVIAMGDKKITAWKKGDNVTTSGFVGTVVRHYHNGMFEVSLSRGVICVGHDDIRVA